MNVIKSVKNYVSNALDFNQATLSGAIDIIAIRDEDGTIRCTPFHVRFGKLQLFKSKEKKVEIYINGELMEGLSMKLGAAGEAFFVERVNHSVGEDYLTSPLSSPVLNPMEPKKEEQLNLDKLSLNESTEKAEFRDSYRIVDDVQMIQLLENSPILENKSETQGWWSWGWDRLPVVRTSPLDRDQMKEHEEYPIHISEDNKTTRTLENQEKRTISTIERSRTLPNLYSTVEEDGWVGSLLGIFRKRNELDAVYSEDITKTIPPRRNPSVYFDAIDAIDHETEEQREVENGIPLMSLCAHLLSKASGDVEAQAIFYENVVSYEDFIRNPSLTEDPNLLFMIRGRLFPWMIAGPYLISAVIYGRPLDSSMLDRLMDRLQGENEASSWFGWIRPASENIKKNSLQLPSSDTLSETSLYSLNLDDSHSISPSWIMSPTTIKQFSTTQNSIESSSSSSYPEASLPKLNRHMSLLSEASIDDLSFNEFFSKSLRPSQEQLQKLPLIEGANRIDFVVNSSLQGQRTVSAVLYLWKPTSKIVISDIDGTISRSNVLGQLMPMVGRDWSYEGVASLYTSIAKNGYQIVYLTSRAIGQTALTKGYLDRILQHDIPLPKGPVLLSPDRLIESFSRIRSQRSEEFKVAALSGIKMLFPKDQNPLYAGFGNTLSDMTSYKAVEIPEGKIFIMDSNGELRNWTGTFRKSYSSMIDHVSDMFPPIVDGRYAWASRNYTHEAFNDQNYWKIPIPLLD